jgi:hypothetical protein
MKTRVTISFTTEHPAARMLSWTDALGISPLTIEAFRIGEITTDATSAEPPPADDDDRSREGLDALLAARSGHRLLRAEHQEDGPWLIVTLANGSTKEQWAIWKRTGAVYAEDPLYPGAVRDDPTFEP